jgi:hypothetical protein
MARIYLGAPNPMFYAQLGSASDRFCADGGAVVVAPFAGGFAEVSLQSPVSGSFSKLIVLVVVGWHFCVIFFGF